MIKTRLAIVFLGTTLCVSPALAQSPGLRLVQEGTVKRLLPHSAAFSPDGKLMAVSGMTGSASMQGTSLHMANLERVIVVVELPSFKVVKELMKGGSGDVFGNSPLEFSSDSQRVMTQESNSILVWDAKKGSRIGKWGKELSSVAFSADLRCALARRSDEMYEALDLTSGQSLGSYPKFDRDAQLLPMDCEKHYLVYAKDGKLILRDLKAAEELVLGEWSSKRAKVAALAADKKTLAVVSDEGKISIWDIASKQKTGEYSDTPKNASHLNFSPDGTQLAFSAEGKLYVWRIPAGPAASVAAGFQMGISDIAFSPDSKRVAVTGLMLGTSVKVWELSR